MYVLTRVFCFILRSGQPEFAVSIPSPELGHFKDQIVLLGALFQFHLIFYVIQDIEDSILFLLMA